jgi:hypothetical protein
MRTDFDDARFELAQRKLMDRMDAQQAAEESVRQSVQEWEDSVSAPALTAIRKITQSAFSERVAVLIVRCLATRIADSNWAHLEHGTDAINVLDELSDALEMKQ